MVRLLSTEFVGTKDIEHNGRTSTVYAALDGHLENVSLLMKHLARFDIYRNCIVMYGLYIMLLFLLSYDDM